MKHLSDSQATSSLDPHAERAKRAWQSREEAAQYRKARHLAAGPRFRREEAIIQAWLRRLRREAERGGLRLVETRGLRQYVSINGYACLERIDPA